MIYKIKYQPNGEIERYKARLVANGFIQKEGFHFYETFALVAKMTTIRIITTLATMKCWNLYQLDVNNAFLHDDLHEEVFLKPLKCLLNMMEIKGFISLTNPCIGSNKPLELV